MIHVYATLLLIIGVIATVVLYVRGKIRGEDRLSRPYFQPLIMLLIGLIGLITPEPVAAYYKAAILLGLILQTVGSALLLLPGMPQVVDKAFTLIALLVYTNAFGALHTLKWPTPWLLLLLAYAGGIGWLLWPRMAELQISVLIYGAILLLMSWQALEVVVVTAGQPWAWVLFSGVICLVLSDSLQAIDRFYRPIRFAKALIPAILFLGQLLLALSIWGPDLGRLFRLF